MILLAVALVIALDLGKQITRLLPSAASKPANIVVDAGKNWGTLPRPWPNLAQGGEESTGMLEKTVDKVKPLRPEYIRLDHLFDFYETVTKENGHLRFNWTGLDKEVEAILKTGAKPFLSLSYLPENMDLNDWQEIVKQTISHYSGKSQKNLQDVYYEVWNEPDLFGGWKIYGEKNYLDLYRRAANGVNQTTNVNNFQFGGPATTGMYKNWLEALFKTASAENLRLDFVSWHHYGLNPDGLSSDVDGVVKLIANYPKLVRAERIISEWGPDAKNNSLYDSPAGAAHALASVREILGSVDKLFWFEIKDGKDPQGQPFWGRWGLLTHESAGLQVKPRYRMLQWLNDLGETRLNLSGEGSFVKGIAAKKGQTIQIYLVNFDPGNANREEVPLLIANLTPGNYQLTKEWFGAKEQVSTKEITAPTYVDNITFSANQSFRLSLERR